MREIKFRAWNDGEMLTDIGITPVSDDSIVYLLEDYGNAVYYPEAIKMQFTGIKDKNGVEIYEGDIIATILEDGYDASVEDGWGYTNCYWNTDTASFDYSNWSPTEEKSSVFHWNYIEVIGNIYENPELLKSNEEISQDYMKASFDLDD